MINLSQLLCIHKYRIRAVKKSRTGQIDLFECRKCKKVKFDAYGMVGFGMNIVTTHYDENGRIYSKHNELGEEV